MDFAKLSSVLGINASGKTSVARGLLVLSNESTLEMTASMVS